MKRDWIKKVKNNTVVNGIVRLGIGTVLAIAKVCIPVNEKKILFVSFNGLRYDDSPRVLYETIVKDDFFKDYELVWAFTEKEKYHIARGKKIDFNSFRYLLEALSAGIWITNVTVERGFHLKRKKTLYVDTWHGTPLKKIGSDAVGNENEDCTLGSIDLFCAQSEYDKKIFSRVYHVPAENILISDLPRNDSLVTYTTEEIQKIKRSLGIAQDKKVLLYMPTYREYDVTEENYLSLTPPIDLKKWEALLKDKYVLLIRAHYLVEKQMDIPDNSFAQSVTNYEKLNDLYAISDILISDYSSAYFDFGILKKPVVCFAYDRDTYLKLRGLYLDLSELPGPVCRNEDEVIDFLLHPRIDERAINEFKNKFTPVSGNAAKKVLDRLKQLIER